MLPTSGGSTEGSRYSSRAQPESLSDEAGGRAVLVLQGEGCSRWGHAGLGRDMSWGQRDTGAQTRGRGRNPALDVDPVPCPSEGPWVTSSWGGAPNHHGLQTFGRTTAGVQGVFGGDSFPLWGLQQTHSEDRGTQQGWGFVC